MGEGGVKKQENHADVFYVRPLRSFKIWPLAFLMPLDENPFKVPQLKALNSG